MEPGEVNGTDLHQARVEVWYAPLGAAVDGRYDIADLDSSLVCGAVGDHITDQGSHRFVEPHSVGDGFADGAGATACMWGTRNPITV